MKRLICTLTLLMVLAPGVAAQPQTSDEEPRWFESYDEGLSHAQAKDLPILLVFHADWCGPCRMMESQTFHDPSVKPFLLKFACIRVNVDEERETAFAWQVNGIPRVFTINVHGQVIGDWTGYMPSDVFIPRIRDALGRVQERQAEARRAPESASLRRQRTLADQLAAKHDDSLTSAVVQIVGDADPDARTRGFELLAAHADKVKPFLLLLLGNRDLAVRVGALEALAKIAETPVYDPWADHATRKQSWSQMMAGRDAPGRDAPADADTGQD